MIKTTNKTLYKYASIDSATHIVRSNRLLLSSPSSFNDVHDSRFTWSKENKQKCESIVRAFCLEEYCYSKGLFACEKKKRDEDSEFQSDFCIDPELQTKMEKAIDCDPGSTRKINTMVAEKMDSFLAAFKAKLDGIKVTCFSSCLNSSLMWAHYGDKNKGVCLRYEGSFPMVEEVRYREDLPAPDLTSFLYGWLKTNEIQLDLEKEPILRDIIYSKGKEWAYEKEHRVCSLGLTNLSEGFWELNQCTSVARITAIYLGCKADLEKAAFLRFYAYLLGIPVYRMILDDKSAGLSVGKEMPPNKTPPLSNKLSLLSHFHGAITHALEQEHYESAYYLSLWAPSICCEISKERLNIDKTYIGWFRQYVEPFVVQFYKNNPNSALNLSQSKIVRNYFGEIMQDTYNSVCRGSSLIRRKYGSLTITEVVMLIPNPDAKFLFIPPAPLVDDCLLDSPTVQGMLRINPILFCEFMVKALETFLAKFPVLARENTANVVEDMQREKDIYQFGQTLGALLGEREIDTEKRVLIQPYINYYLGVFAQVRNNERKLQDYRHNPDVNEE